MLLLFFLYIILEPLGPSLPTGSFALALPAGVLIYGLQTACLVLSRGLKTVANIIQVHTNRSGVTTQERCIVVRMCPDSKVAAVL